MFDQFNLTKPAYKVKNVFV